MNYFCDGIALGGILLHNATGMGGVPRGRVSHHILYVFLRLGHAAT